jgi:hypothetical protein
MFRRRGAYINPNAEQEYVGPVEYEEDEELVADATVYLSDILDSQKRTEELMNEIVNQGDKQVEFLSRLVTLFEGLARER